MRIEAIRPLPVERPRNRYERRMSLRFTESRTKHMLRTRDRALLSGDQWYESAYWRASDGTSPALLADFNRNRYAMPAFGPELVTNGTFDDATTSPWITNGAHVLSINSGALQITASGGAGFPRATRDITTEVGKSYCFSVRARRVAGTPAAAVDLYTSENAFIGSYGSTTSATFVTITGYFIAPTTSTRLFVYIGSGTPTDGDTVEFDNVSLREVMLGDVGPELITNGNFASATGWTLNQPGTSTATISGGLLNLTGDGASAASADQSFTTEIGASYTLVLYSGTASTNVKIGTNQDGIQIAFVATTLNAWNVFSFVATTTTTWIRFARVTASLATVDNVSVRKWTARPTLRSATFSEMFTYTATSDVARTYIDAAGVMRNALAANQPRFTWQNGKRQLLLENASTNLVPYSGTGTNAGWLVSAGTSKTTGQPDLSGGTGALLLTSGGASAAYITLPTPSVNYTSGVTYTLSVFVKQGSARYIQLTHTSAPFGVAQYANFDLVDGILGTVAGGTAKITPIPGGWWRLEFSVAATSTASGTGGGIAIIPSAGSTRLATLSSAGETVTLWGGQNEAQPVATSYIPTPGSSSVQRFIETCQFSALALAVIGRPAISGAVQAQGYRAGTSVTDVPVYWGNSGSRWFAGSRAATTARSSDGSTTVDVTPMASYPTVPFRHAFTFNSSGSRIAINNTISSAAATLTTATMTRTLSYIGRAETTSGPVPGDGYYDHAVLYPTRISDAATQALGVVMS